MGQAIRKIHSINIDNYTLQMVNKSIKLDILHQVALDPKPHSRIEKATSFIAKLSKKIMENNKLKTATKVEVY